MADSLETSAGLFSPTWLDLKCRRRRKPDVRIAELSLGIRSNSHRLTSASQNQCKKHAHVCFLHVELLAYCAQFLDIPSIGRLAVCCDTFRIHLWDSEAWWEILSNALNIKLPSVTGLCESLVKSRDAFRWGTMRLGAQNLGASPSNGKCAYIFAEASRMMRKGFMPCDAAGIREVLEIVEEALYDLDPCCRNASEAAEAFLALASADHSLVAESQLERLDYLYRSTMSLHELMSSSSERQLTATLQDLENSFWAQASQAAFDLDQGWDLRFEANPFASSGNGQNGVCQHAIC